MKKILYLILFLTLILVGCTWYQVREVKIEFGDYTKNTIKRVIPKDAYWVSREGIYTSLPSIKFVRGDAPKLVENKFLSQTGKASWYDFSLKGYPNYSKENYTAASRDYPRGMKLLVCRTDKEATINEVREVFQRQEEGNIFLNQPSGSTNINKCVKVRVNDYVENPDVIIDLSSKVFQELAPLSKGVIDVEIMPL